MSREPTHVSLYEFSRNVTNFFERVIHGQETVVVENKAGEQAVLQPARLPRGKQTNRRKKSAADQEAFLAALGGWKDLVDTDQLVANIYESRQISSRPPVEL